MSDRPKPPPETPSAAPTSTKAAPIAVTRQLTDDFLKLETTQARVLEVITARCPKGTQRADRVDIRNDVMVKAMTTKALARNPESLRPWISRMAQNQVVDFFRRQAVHLAWVRRDVDLEELPPDPVDAPDDEVSVEDVEKMEAAENDPGPRKDEPWAIGPWVRIEIARRKEPHRTRDAQILEMLMHKAAHPELSDEALAALFGMTRDQYKHRLATFKARYVPRRERFVKQRNGFFILLFLAALAVLAYALLWPKPRKPLIGADPDTKPLVPPAPSASVVVPPGPERFNQALPPPQDGPKPK